MNTSIQYFSGILYEWFAGKFELNLFANQSSIVELNTIKNTKWESFIYVSDKPLRQEEKTLNIPGPYKYNFIIRRSGARILLLSENRTIVFQFMETCLGHLLRPSPCAVSIAIEELVNTLSNRPTEYALSFIHARVPAFGVSLRSISFYGDDLASASFFIKNLRLLNPYICGLRRLKGGSEICRLSSDGGISLSFSNYDRIIEVERLLTFLNENKYLKAELLM